MANSGKGSVSKLDYLKKYLSKDKKSAKTTKRLKKSKDSKNLKIIDTEVKFTDTRKTNDSSCDEFDLEEEKPQIYVEGNTLLSEYSEKNHADQQNKWAPVSGDGLKKSDNYDRAEEISTDRPVRNYEYEDDFIAERRRHDSPDLSPRRPRLKNSSPDLSPMRHQHRKGSVDLSPRRVRNDSSSDLSPKRQEYRYKSSKEIEQLDSASDLAVSQDLSLRRKNNHLSLLKKHSHAEVRSQEQSISPDLSPKRNEAIDNLNDKKFNRLKNRHETSPEVVLQGKKAGLQSAKSLHEENMQRKALEDKHFTSMEKSVSGKGATTIYRSKSGKKIDLDEERRKKDEREKQKAVEQVKYDAWKKGLKQQENYDKKLTEDMYEMSKPLARYQDDEDLDEALKLQERDEDPMLAFIRKTKIKSKEKKKEKPRYKGPNPPPNRFNLWPGYRWDGVDRSNGFEKKRFATLSERQSLSNEAYKWSVEDM
eukprot:gene17796-9475_t